jgi:hypothetical protein
MQNIDKKKSAYISKDKRNDIMGKSAPLNLKRQRSKT